MTLYTDHGPYLLEVWYNHKKWFWRVSENNLGLPHCMAKGEAKTELDAKEQAHRCAHNMLLN